MIEWIQSNLAIPLFMGVGAVAMKLIDKFLSKRKTEKELTAQDLQNEQQHIVNFDKLNTLLTKQVEVNLQKYLDILNANINLKGENAALREQLQDLRCEVKQLKKALSDFEIEVSKLKKYIVEHNITVK